MKLPLFIFIIIINHNIISQLNLIKNGSFEEIDSCYGDTSPLGFDVFQWAGCSGWRCPTYASSDLFCENPVFGIHSPPLIPGIGYQFPQEGNNLAGIFIFAGMTHPFNLYREYLQNELQSALETNYYYKINVYLSPSYTDNSTSCFEFYFSDNPITLTTYEEFNYVPQISNDTFCFYTDSLNWTLFSGVYKAQGGEKYVTMGCFKDSLEILPYTTLRAIDGIDPGGEYFFIDNVSLEKLPIHFVIPNVFTPNNDGINDYFYPTVINITDWELKIFNRWGTELITLNYENLYWDGKNYNSGTYYYIFTSKSYSIRESGTINLIKN
jgi:gliding motility-associated-like protein